jgi:hypothetical protein
MTIAPWGGGLGARTSAAGTVQRPNIVFVLTDDLDWSLVTAQSMPHAIALERRGETFDHYVVADSLCCPSRSSIFTGLFPHDSGVYTNTGADGGLLRVHPPSAEPRSKNVRCHHAASRLPDLDDYNIDKDPYERENTYRLLSASGRVRRHRTLMGLERCHNAAACWAAADPQT